ncbi:MAG: hypothetical protein ACK4WH_05605 [Phycisphaerales bacterium]
MIGLIHVAATSVCVLALGVNPAVSHFMPPIPFPPPRRLCTPEEPAGCQSWTLIGRAHDVVLLMKVDEVHRTLVKGSWITAEACNCFFAPCDSDQFRSCDPLTRTLQREFQTCWKVGGEVSVVGKTSLLLSLVGELGVDITVSGEFSSCETVGETLGFTVPRTNCWNQHSREIWIQRRVQGVRVEAETVDYWECQLANLLTTEVRTVCGVRESRGEVSTVGDWTVQDAPYPPCMGAPVFRPDPYDGKRADACCHPLPPCDNLAEAQPPCCGCSGEIR